MGMDDFATGRNECGQFIVRNISPQKKTIFFFAGWPINFGQTRDLLQIPGISESDIKSSLMKGEIRHKLKKTGDIELVFSNIDLLQFNDCGIQYLEGYGFTTGVVPNQMGPVEQQDIQLVGVVNGTNAIFTLPNGVSWIQSPPYKIIVYKNGVKQVLGDDYFIIESGGPGTGYNTVIFTVPPASTPPPPDYMTADYYISNGG